MKSYIIKRHIFLTILYYILHIPCTIMPIVAFEHSAMTCHFAGRFGDDIKTYVKAKLLSLKYNLPLFLKSFEYSDMLTLHTFEARYEKGIEKQYSQVMMVYNEDEIVNCTNPNTLFIIRRGTILRDAPGITDLYKYVMQNSQFANELKKRLQPTVSLPKLDLPTDKITVAVHVRKGGGFDKPIFSTQQYESEDTAIYEEIYIKKPAQYSPYADCQWPTKFPPDQYYIDQIKKLSTMLNDVPLFVHIFTDDPDPQALAEKYERAVNRPNIAFSYEDNNNDYKEHVLEDFYNMAQFDCLIRSTSSFSWASQLVGNYKIIIYPKRARWEDNKMVIEKIDIIFREEIKDIF